MGVASVPLTDVAIRKARPSEKAVQLSDERGLHLEIASSGGKWWRWMFRFGGKEKRLSLGTYPDVGLKADRANAFRRKGWWRPHPGATS